MDNLLAAARKRNVQPSSTLVTHLHFDGNFVDNAKKVWGGAGISFETEKKFGSASILFADPYGAWYVGTDGTHPDWDMQDKDFTIEFWTKHTVNSGNPSILYSKLNSASAWEPSYCSIGRAANSTDITYTCSAPGIGGAQSVQVGTLGSGWHHIAVARQGPNIRVFFDGSLSGTINVGTTVFESTTYPVCIGGCNTSGFSYSGYIDELRVIKGQAMYTAPFTPPSAPFSDPILPEPLWLSTQSLLKISSTGLSDLAFSPYTAWTAHNGATTSGGQLQLNGTKYISIAKAYSAVTCAEFIGTINTTADGLYHGIIASNSGAGSGRWCLGIDPSGNLAVFNSSTNNWQAIYTGIPTGEHHFALCMRNGWQVRLAVDGVWGPTWIEAYLNSSSTGTVIGRLDYTVNDYYCDMTVKEVRITCGVPRYDVFGGGFTPPSTFEGP